MLPLGGKNRKDVAGYDLLSLFVGSEGTLGVVTQATLRLLPRPAERRLLWASFGDETRALRAVPTLYAAGAEPSACEFMERRAAEVSAESLSLALPADADAHLFVEVDGFDEAGVARDAEQIGERLLEAGATDVRVAMTEREQRDFWRLRRAVGEAVKRLGPYAEEDCAVPRAQLPELLRAVREISRRRGLTAICYGHAADGNIHVNVVQPPGERDRWLAERDAAVEEIFRTVVGLGGTITGEHGVGLTQRAYLSLRHSPEVIAAMRAVKEIFDPEGILNPGKIFARMIRLARKISFNAGRSLWRPEWTPEKNLAVYGDEGPHGYGHNYELEVAVEGTTDASTGMVVNLTDLDRVLKEEVDRPARPPEPESRRARFREDPADGGEPRGLDLEAGGGADRAREMAVPDRAPAPEVDAGLRGRDRGVSREAKPSRVIPRSAGRVLSSRGVKRRGIPFVTAPGLQRDPSLRSG